MRGELLGPLNVDSAHELVRASMSGERTGLRQAQCRDRFVLTLHRSRPAPRNRRRQLRRTAVAAPGCNRR